MVDDAAIVEADLFLIILEGPLDLLLDEVLPDALIVNFDVLLAESGLDLEDHILLMKAGFFIIA